MAKGAGTTRKSRAKDWYAESRRLRAETLAIADGLKGNPISVHISNGIEADLVVTKSDIKTIVSKNTSDNKFNALKNKLAQDIVGIINDAKYLGWRETIDGKHPEAAYFVYYQGQSVAYLCI